MSRSGILLAAVAFVVTCLLVPSHRSAAQAGLEPTLAPVTGVVTDEDGEPLAGVGVELWTNRTSDTYYRWRDTITDENGAFTLQGRVGSFYYLFFGGREGRSDYQSRWWGHDRGENFDDRVWVKDDAGVSGFDTSLVQVVSISGRVADAGGEPIERMTVKLYELKWYGWSGGSQSWYTDADGRFAIYPDGPGSYRLSFEDLTNQPRQYAPQSYPTGGGFGELEGQTLVLERGTRLTGIDVTMQRPSTIVGRAPPDGPYWPGESAPEVSAHRLVNGKFVFQDSGGIDRDGDIRLPRLPAGTYIVCFWDLGEHRRFFYGGPTVARATRVRVPAASTVELPEPVITSPRGRISGTVRDARGRPVANARVSWQSPWHKPGPYLTPIKTDSRGRYLIFGLTRGFYRVGATLPPRTQATLYWPRSRSYTDAVDIAVRPGVHVRGIDLTLPDPPVRQRADRRREPLGPTGPAPARAGRGTTWSAFPGRVRGTGGVTLLGIHVLPYRAEGGRWVPRGRPGVSHRDMGFGPRYTVEVPPGRYRLRAVDRTWRFWGTEWLGGMRKAKRSRVLVAPVTGYRGPNQNFLLEPMVRAFGRPQVQGRARPGAVLRVEAGQWSPHDVRLTYRWYRDGAPIPGATGRRYEVRPADRGARLRVQVVGRRPTMLPRTVVSAAIVVR